MTHIALQAFRAAWPTLVLALSAFALAAVVAQSKAESQAVTAEEPDAGESIELSTPAERPWLPPRLTSGLGVPAGETFHLGERPTGDFIVSAKNIGQAAVTIYTKRDKLRETIGRLEPGETVVRRFQSGDGVLIRNDSKRQKAKLTVEAWGTRDLAMYYVPNEDEAR